MEPSSGGGFHELMVCWLMAASMESNSCRGPRALAASGCVAEHAMTQQEGGGCSAVVVVHEVGADNPKESQEGTGCKSLAGKHTTTSWWRHASDGMPDGYCHLNLNKCIMYAAPARN